jgi:hypothetical protein
LKIHCVKHHVKAVFEKISESPGIFSNRPTYWDSYLHKLSTSEKDLFVKFSSYKEQRFSYTALPEFKKNTLLDGYFQSEKYFAPYKKEILSQLSLPQDKLKHIHDNFSELFKLPNKLAIHIRRGDYLKLKHAHTVLSQTDYYQRALRFFPDIKHLVIFSDDITWCKKHIKKILTPGLKKYIPSLVKKEHAKREFHFIQSDDISELYVMSQCQHHIVANSSFSWWAAYMSPYNGKVIAPKKWFGKNLKHHSTQDLYISSWKIV